MSFIAEALAATSAASQGNIGQSLAGFIPLILIFLVFYFLIIRPQQKKIKAHSQLLDSIKKGDKVIISGGILGSVNKVSSDNLYLFVEVASGVEVKVLKSSITDVTNKTSKVATESKVKEKEIKEK